MTTNESNVNPPEPPAPPEPPVAPTADPDRLQSDIDTIRHVLDETDKSRDPHALIIAVGNFVSGAIFLIAVPFLLMAFGIVGLSAEAPPGEPSPTMIVGGVFTVVIFVLFLFSLPFLLAGWGLLKRKRWGPALAIVAGVLNLLNLPLGTALGIYTFWAFSQGKLNTTS